MATTVFHGTIEEKFALEVALTHNCACEFDPESGARCKACVPHEALIHDQRFLDGLLFERRQVRQLYREEFTP